MIKKKHGITALLLIFILGYWSSLSYTDDSIIADYGHTVAPVKTDEIRMIEEEVIINVDTDLDNKKAPFPLRRANVKCTFLFNNTSEKMIEATVGFPSIEHYEITGTEPISDFITIIDGHKYNITPKKEYSKDSTEIFRNWYTWEMKFPPKSSVKVVNNYSYILSSASGYNPLYLNYILSTGSNWKGKIGKATIKVIYKNTDELENKVCGIEPKGWFRKRNEIIWEFKDFEPTEAYNIRICERGWPIASNQEREPLLFKKE